MANADTLASNWKSLRPRIKEHWHALSDDDLKLIDGDRDTLASVLCEKYSYPSDRAQAEIDQFLKDTGAHPRD